MPIEVAPELDLDAFPGEEALLAEVSNLEKQLVSVVTLTSSLWNWDKIKGLLLALRAANIAPVLLLRRGDDSLEDDELAVVLEFLRVNDQFLLHNFLELCGEWVPQNALPLLQNEAKIELKWFKEWSVAVSDPNYPGLPWRRFIRKINGENYAFVIRFLELIQAPSSAENNERLKAHLKAFLEEKKKVVNIFPKRFNRSH